MEMILWLALGITAGIGVVLAAIPVAAAFRLHRRTSEEMRENIVRFERDRKRGARLTDHRYDPKQFRRR